MFINKAVIIIAIFMFNNVVGEKSCQSKAETKEYVLITNESVLYTKPNFGSHKLKLLRYDKLGVNVFQVSRRIGEWLEIVRLKDDINHCFSTLYIDPPDLETRFYAPVRSLPDVLGKRVELESAQGTKLIINPGALVTRVGNTDCIMTNEFLIWYKPSSVHISKTYHLSKISRPKISQSTSPLKELVVAGQMKYSDKISVNLRKRGMGLLDFKLIESKDGTSYIETKDRCGTYRLYAQSDNISVIDDFPKIDLEEITSDTLNKVQEKIYISRGAKAFWQNGDYAGIVRKPGFMEVDIVDAGIKGKLCFQSGVYTYSEDKIGNEVPVCFSLKDVSKEKSITKRLFHPPQKVPPVKRAPN